MKNAAAILNSTAYEHVYNAETEEVGQVEYSN